MLNINVKSYTHTAIDRKEVLRYAGVPRPTPEVESLLDECLTEAEGAFTYKVCYAFIPADEAWGRELLAELSQGERTDTLCGAIIFAATVGIEIDRLIAKYGRLAPSRALMLQALGAERIEALCDAFCQDAAEDDEFREMRLLQRVSPGYGSFPLDAQRRIFSLLDCHRKIGLSLSDGLTMSPSKSVTALVAIERT